MCGLFGWITSKDTPTLNLAITSAILATMNDTRGGHSWGFYDGLQIIKGLGNITSDLINHRPSTRYALCHTRYATIGARTIENAHPFEFPAHSLIGAHNGAVYNYNKLNTDLGRHCAVDSQHLFLHIAEDRDMTEIEGYGAITFDHHNILHLARLRNGDLSCVLTQHGLFWSSVESHLLTALNAGGFVVRSKFKLKEGQTYIADERGLCKAYKIHLGNSYNNSRTPTVIGGVSTPVSTPAHSPACVCNKCLDERYERPRLVASSTLAPAPSRPMCDPSHGHHVWTQASNPKCECKLRSWTPPATTETTPAPTAAPTLPANPAANLYFDYTNDYGTGPCMSIAQRPTFHYYKSGKFRCECGKMDRFQLRNALREIEVNAEVDAHLGGVCE